MKLFWELLLSFFLFGYHIVFSFASSILFLYAVFVKVFNFAASFVIDKKKKDKRLVIIGGGFAGASAAKKLEDYFLVTLIDSKDYFEFTPSVLRTIVEPNHVNKIQILHQKFLNLTRTTIVTSSAVDVQKDGVVITDGRKIQYDYLLICVGTTYNVPFKEMNVILAMRGGTLSRCYQQLKSSESILVIGGGIVGVELAAEIAMHFPKKKLTLVHSGPHLMSNNKVPINAVNYATNALKKIGVNLVLHERVTVQEKKTFKTLQGTSFQADLAFLATGIVSNTFFLKNSILKESIDEKGFIKVNEYLQVQGFNNIFAAGDVCAIDEEKLAQNAEASSDIVIDNILHHAMGRKMHPYIPAHKAKVISLGKYDGVATYQNWWISGFITALMKEFVEWMVMVTYQYKAGSLLV